MTEVFPTIPGYQILKQMGQGGMATVYLAVQESFGRQVALKIMSDQLGQDELWTQRFMHEARVVAQLSHSNIVPVFDVGSHNSRFYISMESLKGGCLDERIAKGLSVADAIKIACGVAAGLDYAGSKGFVHRDIKPDNIMFRDDGTPVILDFGIAKQKDGDSKMTKTGTIVGTTGYMSPEQAMGQELDERSDIYSLGIMLYELLTGSVPFKGDSAVAVLLKHVQEMPPPLPDDLKAFQSVMDRTLAKKPEERYQRANEMIEHMQESLAVYKQQYPSANKTSATQIAINTSAVVVATAKTSTDKTVVTSSLKTRVATPVTPAASAPLVKKKGLSRPVAIVLMILIVVLLGLRVLHKKSLAKTVGAAAASAPAAAVVPVLSPTPNPAVSTEEKPAVVIAPAVPATPATTSTPEPASAPIAPTLVEPKPVVEASETKIPAKSVAKNTAQPKATAAVKPVEQPVEAPSASKAEEPTDDETTAATEDKGDRRAVMRILMGARVCMRNQQYDCAKSKAEAALDLEPDNENAKRILANAKKAQQDAFSGDWNAK